MSTDLEHDLRELFARDAARAPVPRHLAEGARVRAGQQARRQRRVAVVGSAVVAAALIGGFALIRPTAEHSAPTSSRPPAPTATTVSSEGPVVAEKPALYFHNVEVPVPAAMLTAPVNCGAPKSDAAYVVGYDGGGCPANAKGAPRVTTVVLQPWRAAGIPAPPVGTHVLADGRTQMVTAIPSTDLRFIVTSPDPKRADRLFNGLRIIEMAHGCPVHADATLQPLGDAVQSDRLEGGSVCAYGGGQLVGSAWLDARQASGLLRLARVSASSATCPSPSGVPVVDYWDVHLRFAAGEQVVRVPFDACNDSPLQQALDQLAPPPLAGLRS